MQDAQPRRYSPGAGMPGDRAAHFAARQAFVDLKQTFLHTLRGTAGAEWLCAQVRAAEEPVDLWLLRAPMFAALSGPDTDLRARRQQLRRGLDSVFPDLEPPSAFVPF